jgi:flagella basal body P-ring formation protein FlgA
MSAIALEDGAAGAMVAVKNDRSGRRLQAVVVGPGVVRVQLDDPSIGG